MLGDLIRFHFTQGHDLVGTDGLPAGIQAGIVIADEVYDADERVSPRWNKPQRGS